MRQDQDEEGNTKQIQKDKVIQEMKMAVMEKAVEKNPASVRLKLEQLQLCRDEWERYVL